MQIKVFNIRLDKENFEKDQKELNDFLETVTFKKSSVSLIESKVNFWSIIIHYDTKEVNYIEEIENKKITTEDIILSEREKEIIAYFKQWRLDKAKEINLPAYTILTNKTIYEIAKKNPSTIEELNSISGIGEHKKDKYGEDIIALLNSI